ncbi:hypothetical protein [Brevundimonas sp. PAMC22021]|uniref:hypothetical protein n=1 Tax=Brevundimonas sp. PAMC22021 TaxID=2861285 RepID=UPI001C639D8F|nr:hypothetical protein [Brevundimonas sp. PAMC22021]QYF87709.1 hypothetical protein KY493_04200 [Brevundimonas sp. PAMC22021]
MSLSATEAAFEGFRIVRRKPMVVVWWALVYAALFILVFALGGPQLIELTNVMETMDPASPSQADVQRVMMIYASLFWLVPVGLLFGAVLNAAIARAVLRPEESRWGYLRLGRDEMRILGVTVILGLLFGLLSLASASLIGVVGAIATTTGQAVLWLVAVIVGAAALAFVVFLAIRLSLTVPITFTEKRIALKESFRATKGVFWPLLGMAVIAVIMSLVVNLLGGVVALPITLATGGLQSLSAMEGAPIGEVLATAAPAIIAWIVINSLLSALQLAVIYAPFAAAWRDIRPSA